MPMKTHQVTVIGSGIAGMTCAIYLRDAGIDTAVVGRPEDSALAFNQEVKNYPGFCNVSGKTIVSSISDSLDRFGAARYYARCDSLVRDEVVYRIRLDDGTEFATKKVVIATGRRSKIPPQFENFVGNGVYACAYRDGWLFSGKEVAVVGSGDSAVREAVYLSRIARSVSVLSKDNYIGETVCMDEFESAARVGKIIPLYEREIDYAEKIGSLIRVTDMQGGFNTYDAIFLAVGRVPNSDFLRGCGSVRLDSDGEILSQPAVNFYTCGDIRPQVTQKAVIAAGDGASVAVEIIESMK